MRRMLAGRMVAALGLWWAAASAVSAQEAPRQPDAPAAPAPSGARPRQLAPGVLIPVDPARQLQETFSNHDIVELLAVDPKFDWAKDVVFRHDVWVLAFKFKPVRMMWVDIPQPNGQMQRKLIWYMVYTVTNNGKVMHPVADADLPYDTKDKPKLYEVKLVDRPIRFFPSFLLEGRESLVEGEGFVKAYPDRVIPVAVAAIQQREDPARRLSTTIEMCREIAVGETLWGVVTWEDIDPQVDRFSIYVKGLTNAYRWTDEPGAFKTGQRIGTGRKLVQKTLKLNFWRPGDEFLEHEREIRFGVPGELDYEWVYR